MKSQIFLSRLPTALFYINYGFFVVLLFALILPVPTEFRATTIPTGTIIDQNIDAVLPVLQTVTIPPGATWSFNEQVGNPAQYQLITAYGVYGGGWCDLASRYAELARKMNLPHTFQQHSTPLLHVAREDNVSIWNETGKAGQPQDLTITNTRTVPISFIFEKKNDSYTLTGYYSYPLGLLGSLVTTR
jgi:hypothetical protein